MTDETLPPPVPGTQDSAPPIPGAPPAAPPPAGPAGAGAGAAPTVAETTDPTSEFTSTCPSCGAQTAYSPGTTTLKCPSCGAVREIEGASLEIHEHSYDDWESKNGQVRVADLGTTTMACKNCGAVTETKDLAGTCQFCGGALIAKTSPEGLVPPEAVIPFHVDRSGAQGEFGKWVKSRWFAPNALKKVGSAERLAGTYLPHWTFDAQTATDYTGQRGEYYYTTETRTVSDGKGGTRTETYQQRHTRWYPASGHVSRFFDDVLVPATHLLPSKKLQKMGPWRLGDAKPFQVEYLTGYSAVRYDVDPDTGAGAAREEMKQTIDQDCRRDIGGDEQRVSSMDVTYSQAMFKLMLMPLWIASYLYAGKTWQVLVNANTGEVVGDRPYSKLKIAMAVLAALIVIGVIVAVVAANKSSS